ncbi:MAG TPA: NADH-quinone oxidoreductase subunit H [Thermomicrobiales bacterium]|nr:NADH-quinone oxidoreductase subunit H [Thermomicrobiales bacterium]
MDLLLLAIQIPLMLLAAPLVQGAIKTTKARLQSRRGPGPLQPYRDVLKWLSRESVVSDQASWVFRYAPFVYAGAILSAAVLVPTVARRSPAAAVGDAIVFVALFALARFWLAIAGLDTASNFGGMGSSREVAFAALIEPALLLVIFAVALPVGSTSLTALVSEGWPGAARVIALCAFMIVIIAETGRVPIDNPDTHLELTMVHEGMLLEYSGRPLGVLHWATHVKQLAVLSLASALFLPWGMAPGSGATALALLVGLLAWSAKLLALGLVLAAIETLFAKLRIFRAPDLIGAASVLGLLAVLTTFVVEH